MFFMISDASQPKVSPTISSSIVSIFPYFVGGAFSSLLSYKLDPRRLASTSLLIIGFGSTAQYWNINMPGSYVTQAIIAHTRSAALPCLSSNSTKFYTDQDYILQASIVFPISALFDIAFTLAAFGVIMMGEAGVPARWRRAWLLYGLLSCIVAISFRYLMPPSPLKVSSYKVLEKWFTPRELTIIVNRVLQDNPFYDNSQKRLKKPKIRKTLRIMFFSFSGVMLFLTGIVLGFTSIFLSVAVREYIERQDRLAEESSLDPSQDLTRSY
ncbi:uncharacterized protein V1516DRAFT_688196 [Lipomyces oligophaga]|uniref:uncharacterized protein n=1 Tax=Lipomyces oligophaga TaxID=45792 RepID=UPI0034CE5416